MSVGEAIEELQKYDPKMKLIRPTIVGGSIEIVRFYPVLVRQDAWGYFQEVGESEPRSFVVLGVL